MLDLKFIRENKEKVANGIKDKGFNVDLNQVLALDDQRKKLQKEAEDLRAIRNKQVKTKPSEAEIKKLRQLREKIKVQEEEVEELEHKLSELLMGIPNLAADDVPVGSDETGNKVLRKWGEPKKFTFKPKDHVELGQKLDLIDIERGTKVSQSGFYFLKNEGALLEFALINFVLGKLVKKGFTPCVTPELVKERIMVGCGFQARSDKERQVYNIEGEDLDLIATAEITLVGQHTDETIEVNKLPMKYAGFSSCYRVEKGSYGKDVRGILRVHEFDKVEMVAFTKPEDSVRLHEEFLKIEEEIFQELEIPYQVLLICTGDLGSAAAKKYDVEAWIPSQEKYRELTSTSNTTDFQARRLNIKFRNKGESEYLHTVNGTACAIGRTIIAILENYQEEDGSVRIPQVLQGYLGKETISKE